MILLRVIVNWSMILTAPLWSGVIYPLFIFKELINDTGTTRQVMAGKDWIWKIK